MTFQWHASIYADFYNMQRHKVLHVSDAMVLRGQQLITLSFVIRLIIAKRTYFKKHLILKHLKYVIFCLSKTLTSDLEKGKRATSRDLNVDKVTLISARSSELPKTFAEDL